MRRVVGLAVLGGPGVDPTTGRRNGIPRAALSRLRASYRLLPSSQLLDGGRLDMSLPLIRALALAAGAYLFALALPVPAADAAKDPGASAESHSAPPQANADASSSVPDYVADVQPIFNRRCIACHGCLGSPCNVKLDSFRGLERGGFGLNAYSVHASDYPRTDMEAAHSLAAWRKKGFYPIVARDGGAENNLDNSLLYLMIEAGRAHNSPGFSRAALKGLRPERYMATCPPKPAALKAELQKHPAIGMPFGLPALSDNDFETLKQWVANGSPGPTKAQQHAAQRIANPRAVLAWESFLNGDDKRAQLVSRYIFEHMFLATIVLEESPGDQFRLVRSKTPPARVVKGDNGDERVEIPPVEVIGTGLPYDDPYSYANIERFWYRLEKVTEPAVQKNHFLWQLSLDDIDHLTELFALDSGKGWGGRRCAQPRLGQRQRARGVRRDPGRIALPLHAGELRGHRRRYHLWAGLQRPDRDLCGEGSVLGLLPGPRL